MLLPIVVGSKHFDVGEALVGVSPHIFFGLALCHYATMPSPHLC